MTSLRWFVLAALWVRAAAAQPPSVITLPLDMLGSTPLVSVRVNGSPPQVFIVDSGASSCVLDDALARRLRLAPVDTGAATGAGKGTTPYRRYRSDAVAFRAGLARFTCPDVISLDLSGQPAVLGRRIDGILGTGLLAQYVVELDYETATLRLHPRDGFAYRGPGETLPLTFENKVPHVVARLTVAGAHKGCPVPSPVLLKKWVDSFVGNIRAFAARNRIPVVQFQRNERKEDVARRPDLPAHQCAFPSRAARRRLR